MKVLGKAYWAIAVLIMVLFSVACTHNNGDIGPWFGTWRVESITINGEPAPGYDTPSVIWKFQSNITLLQFPDLETHKSMDLYGSWQQDGDKLKVDFDHENIYFDPDIAIFPQVTTFDIITLSSKKIVIEYIDAGSGNTYVYTLKKFY